MSPFPSNPSWSSWRGGATLAPFSRTHWLTWSQEGSRQMEVPRREEAAAAATAAEAAAVAAVAAMAVAAASVNKKILSPWWQPQGDRPE